MVAWDQWEHNNEVLHKEGRVESLSNPKNTKRIGDWTIQPAHKTTLLFPLILQRIDVYKPGIQKRMTAECNRSLTMDPMTSGDQSKRRTTIYAQLITTGNGRQDPLPFENIENIKIG